MALVESLLTAIVRADGDALVLHVGERPYVVAASGQVELSTRTLTLEAISGILGQLISPAAEKSLEELGAVEHELAPLAVIPDERFAIVAARGGNDIWMEIRRQRPSNVREPQGRPVASVDSPVGDAVPVTNPRAAVEPSEIPAAPIPTEASAAAPYPSARVEKDLLEDETVA
ncbi:MAG: hypothetical protein ACRD1Q_00105, partial [Vicinamibacterales bacterium]